MPNLNQVMLMGNLTRDPEVSYTPKGTAVASIGLAINRNYKTESGEAREETTFVDVELWGKLAELVGEYVFKGDPLFIQGRLKLDTWDDKQTGQKRSKMRVVGEGMQFLKGKPGRPESDDAIRTDHGAEAEKSAGPRKPRQLPKPDADPDLDAVKEDDVPF